MSTRKTTRKLDQSQPDLGRDRTRNAELAPDLEPRDTTAELAVGGASKPTHAAGNYSIEL